MTSNKFFLIFCYFILLVASSNLFPEQKQIKGVPETQIVFEFSETVKTTGDSRLRSVAFHSITFIDSSAKPISELIFGTNHIHDIEGKGWFENEVIPNIGSIQWAGGTDKRSRLGLYIPEGTRGILLYITSIQDSIWMEVKINDSLATTLRVDKYWHHGYVPVGEVAQEPIPNTEPEWHEGRYFPFFPTTDEIFVFRISAPIADWIHGAVYEHFHSFELMMDLTITTMQGLINRNKPRVYIEWYDPVYENTYLDVSQFWTPLLAEHVNIIKMEFDGLSAFNFLMQRFANRFSGIVLYDPEVPETINLATMIAGLENRIMLAPEQLDLPGMPDFESVTDLRELVAQQGWDKSEESKYQIYQWVYDNLWQDLEHRIISIVSPGPPTSRLITQKEYYPIELAIRDYIVALKLPILWLSPIEEPQKTLFGKFLEEAPSPIPVTGVFWTNEGETVDFVSQYGGHNAAINYHDEACGGLTVLSGIRPDIIKYTPEIDNSKILATLEKSHIAAMFSSDGDAIYYQLMRGFWGHFGWDTVQDQCFGWTMNPVLSEVAPVVWNYYVQSRSQVGLLTGISGAGFATPQLMNNERLQNYLYNTAFYMNETGIKVVSVASQDYPWTRELGIKYYEALRDEGLLGIVTDYVGSHHNFYIDYIDIPVPVCWYKNYINGHNMTEISDNILAENTAKVFMRAVDTPHTGQTYEDPASESGQVVLISQDHEIGWAVWPNTINLTPGDYNITFRLKVSDNTVDGNVARLWIWRDSGGNIAERLVTATEFDQANEYQKFEFPLSLEYYASDVSFVADYEGAPTDLYIDNMQAERIGGANLPYFELVMIANLGFDYQPGETLFDAPGQFTKEFENGGGIVLSPDEYMAALNPEYMINLAATILGIGNQGIQEAQQLLDEGHYMKSLITVREALKSGPNSTSRIYLDPDQISIKTNETCSLKVAVENVNNLGGFQIELSFNTDIVQVDTAFIAPFLSSTGREISITDYSIDNINSIGKISFSAISTGVNSGPSGSDTIATFILTAKEAGISTIELQNVQLTDTDGALLPVTSLKSGKITVTTSAELWTNMVIGDYQDFTAVKTVSDQVAWISAASKGTLLRTTNGGNSWENVWGPVDELYIQAIEAQSADTALIAGITGNIDNETNVTFIYRTIDGGLNWEKVFEQNHGLIQNITMFNSLTGMAVGNPVNGVWTILKTGNGGQNWSQMSTAPVSNGDEQSFSTAVTWLDSLTCWRRCFYNCF